MIQSMASQSKKVEYNLLKTRKLKNSKKLESEQNNFKQ